MHKKRILTSILTSILIISIALIILSGNLRLIGLTIYDGGVTDFCGATVTDDSSFSANQNCILGTGGTLSTAGIKLNCASYTTTGDSVTETAHGILATADNQKITNCDVRSFGYNLNISSENVSIINSKLNSDSVTAEAVI